LRSIGKSTNISTLRLCLLSNKVFEDGQSSIERRLDELNLSDHYVDLADVDLETIRDSLFGVYTAQEVLPRVFGQFAEWTTHPYINHCSGRFSVRLVTGNRVLPGSLMFIRISPNITPFLLLLDNVVVSDLLFQYDNVCQGELTTN